MPSYILFGRGLKRDRIARRLFSVARGNRVDPIEEQPVLCSRLVSCLTQGYERPWTKPHLARSAGDGIAEGPGLRTIRADPEPQVGTVRIFARLGRANPRHRQPAADMCGHNPRSASIPFSAHILIRLSSLDKGEFRGMLVDCRIAFRQLFINNSSTVRADHWSFQSGAGGEAWAPPPPPTPWANRQGNPGSRGSSPSQYGSLYPLLLAGLIDHSAAA